MSRDSTTARQLENMDAMYNLVCEANGLTIKSFEQTV